MSTSPVLLRSVNKADNSTSAVPASTCIDALLLASGEYQVHYKAVIHVREQLDGLFAGCSPAIRIVIGQYLDTPREEDRWLLDAWEKCGRHDLGRSLKLDLTSTARSTLTALGVACLIRYCRGWLDEAEARTEAIRSKVLAASQGSRPKAPGERSPAKRQRARQRPKAAG